MSEALRLLLGPGLDVGAPWRHRLPEQGCVGWMAVGPLGFVRQLALSAGISTQVAAPAARVAASAVALAQVDTGDRSYSRSRQVDPLGTARRMLQLYDELRWLGWDGRTTGDPQSASDLLTDLAALTGAAPEGSADLAHRVIDALARGFQPQIEVELTAPLDELPPVVAGVLDHLTATAPAAADEAESGVPGPELTLLEAETPGEAAELLAAWLVDHPAERRTVVVEAEAATLRAALRRRGLPGIDGARPSRHRPDLQLLPLRLGLAFRPQDPRRALELLMLPRPPLPWAVRRRLIDALNEAPGIGGPAWNAAAEGDEEAVDTWFGGDLADPSVGIAAGVAAALCGHVTSWCMAQGFDEAGGVASGLRRMLDGRPRDELVPRLELLRMHDEAVGVGRTGEELPAEADGAAQCDGPQSVLPGAQQVVWWGFVDGDGPTQTPWSEAERRALQSGGARLPNPGAAREVEARQWRRALQAASDDVVLVRWRLSGAGACAPHPLLDQLEVDRGRQALAERTVTARHVLAGGGWPTQVCARPVSAPPAGPAIWQPGAGLLRPRHHESPTSIQRLLTCPLKWTLQYPARLRAGARATMPDGPRLAGTFMHALLQDLLLRPDPPTDPDVASREVVAMFDARVDGEAAPLLMPGRGSDLRDARRSVGRAAAALVDLLEAGGWRVTDAERELQGGFGADSWRGRADLILERAAGAPGVVDLKLGRSSNRRTELAEGRALQIALYAQGVTPAGAPRAPAAYFSFSDGRTLTVDGEAFPGGVAVEGDDLADTVALAEQGWRRWWSLLDAGIVAARPLLDDGDRQQLDDAATIEAPQSGPAAAKATCDWCDFAGLCLTGRES